MNDKLIYSPPEASSLTVKLMEDYRNNPDSGTSSGIDKLDQHLTPWRSHIVIVQGFTNHGKTTLMNYIAKQNSLTCAEDEIIVHIDTENSLEEAVIKDISAVSDVPIPSILMGKTTDFQWKQVMQAAMNRAQKPIWLMALSEKDYRSGQRATVPMIQKALNFVQETQGKKVKMVVLDYFQRIRFHDNKQPARIVYSEMVNMLQDIALGCGAPLLLGCQTSRSSKKRDNKMPALQDLLETSNLEQSARTVISCYMPGKEDYRVGELWGIGKGYTVTDDLIMLSILKQKGPCPKHIPMRINYEKMNFAPFE